MPLPRVPRKLGSLVCAAWGRHGRVYEMFPVIEGGSAGLRGWRLIWLATSVGFSQECDSWSDLLAFVRPVLILAAGVSVVAQAGLVPQSEVMGRPSRLLSGQRETAKEDGKGGGQSGAPFRVARNGCKGLPHPPASAQARDPPLPLVDGQSAAWHHLGSKLAEWVLTSAERPRATESLSGALWLCSIYIMRMWSLDGLCCRCPRATHSRSLSSSSLYFLNNWLSQFFRSFSRDRLSETPRKLVIPSFPPPTRKTTMHLQHFSVLLLGGLAAACPLVPRQSSTSAAAVPAATSTAAAPAATATGTGSGSGSGSGSGPNVSAAALQAILTSSGSCSGAQFPDECRTAEQAAPFITKACANLNKAECAATIALMGYESGDLKFKHNVTPGVPGQGTSNMMQPNVSPLRLLPRILFLGFLSA